MIYIESMSECVFETLPCVLERNELETICYAVRCMYAVCRCYKVSRQDGSLLYSRVYLWECSSAFAIVKVRRPLRKKEKEGKRGSITGIGSSVQSQTRIMTESGDTLTWSSLALAQLKNLQSRYYLFRTIVRNMYG